MRQAFFVSTVVSMALLFVCARSTHAQGQSAASPGADLYVNNCAACHGLQGEGDGPVAAVMNVRVPNLRNLADRNNGQFPTAAVRAYIDGRNLPAAHGDRLMPIWGDEFGYGEEGGEASEEQIAARIDAIVEFLKTIQYR
jgi:mono/diheme cytochrome c family protein